MKIAIIGRTQILYDTAISLLENGHSISCIITAKAAPEYTRTEDDFQKLASKVNASFFISNTMNNPEITKACRGTDLGVSINWVSVITKRHIDLFKLGILNAHLGDLPRYRGNACPNWAIINDEEKIVVSVHFMEGDELDCGRILGQEKMNLTQDISITDIYEWAEQTTPALFVQAISAVGKKQDFFLKYADPNSPESFRCYPRLPQDNFIDWNLPASSIHNLIRSACHPFSGAYTYLRLGEQIHKLIITKSRLMADKSPDLAVAGQVLQNNLETGESFVQCGHGVLALLECRYHGEHEKFMPGRKWKSIRMRLGVRTEDLLWEIYQKL